MVDESVMTYEQVHKDHSYLWAIAPAEDMSGGYVVQDDLKKILGNPTKEMAKKCLCDQIEYWFGIGPDVRVFTGSFGECYKQYPEIINILKRHKVNFCAHTIIWG